MNDMVALPVKRKHYGFALLRTIMCFVVVLCHFWHIPTRFAFVNYLEILKPMAVPVFMMMSFFLVSKSFGTHNPGTAKKRLVRLVWPQIAWAVIYWLFYFPIGKASVRDLLWQILTGHSESINPTMWFQTDMILLTALFFLVFHAFSRKKALLSLGILSFISFAAQYAGINYALFSNLRYELKYPLGRLTEVLPYAVAGICFADFHIDRFLQKKPVLTALVSCAVLAGSLIAERVFPYSAPGFGYSGVFLFVEAVAVFSVAAVLPIYNIHKSAVGILNVLTNYSLGIYCSHRLVAWFIFETSIGSVLNSVFGITLGSFSGCIVIYLGCYILCTVLSLFRIVPIKRLVN